MEVPIQMNEAEEDELRSKLYSESLIVDVNRIPDPFTELKDGWLCEKESKQLWPPLSYFETAAWLLVDATCPSQPSRPNVRARPNGSPSGSIGKNTNVTQFSGPLPTSLKDRLLSDYKEGKAFSYFDNKWSQELFYHHISEDSPLCFIMANCLPSQNVRAIPHMSWVCLEKETGKIRNAYCTCVQYSTEQPNVSAATHSDNSQALDRSSLHSG
ncbi:hypothetical protein HOLleu_26819 [Holothuria leucospilota]|uniref:Uncharacterized protein n=1 Tax=Holothuria leucospilota TaxID=206669 RepID=A0A9Q1BPH6_HOLLE|nr:hypothetical protein HOLleu_26819 [Holothuria leucospilota]